MCVLTKTSHLTTSLWINMSKYFISWNAIYLRLINALGLFVSFTALYVPDLVDYKQRNLERLQKSHG